jgi:hypothetical protein
MLRLGAPFISILSAPNRKIIPCSGAPRLHCPRNHASTDCRVCKLSSHPTSCIYWFLAVGWLNHSAGMLQPSVGKRLGPSVCMCYSARGVPLHFALRAHGTPLAAQVHSFFCSTCLCVIVLNGLLFSSNFCNYTTFCTGNWMRV